MEQIKKESDPNYNAVQQSLNKEYPLPQNNSDKVIEDNKTIIDCNLDLYKKFKANTETYEYNKKLCELAKPMKVVQ